MAKNFLTLGLIALVVGIGCMGVAHSRFNQALFYEDEAAYWDSKVTALEEFEERAGLDYGDVVFSYKMSASWNRATADDRRFAGFFFGTIGVVCTGYGISRLARYRRCCHDETKI